MMASQPPRAHGLGREVGVARPVPVTDDGLGSSVAKTRSPRRCGRAASGPPRAGRRCRTPRIPIWNSTGPSSPRRWCLDAEPASMQALVWRSTMPGRASCRRRRPSSRALGGVAVERPAEGRPSWRTCTPARCRTRLLVGYFSAAARHLAGVSGAGEVGEEDLAHDQLVAGSRRGSGHTKTGESTQSESLPVAWFVDDPSKPQMPAPRRRGRSWSWTAAG